MGHVGILVPWPGIEPMPLAVEAPSHNHWIAREVPSLIRNLFILDSYPEIVTQAEKRDKPFRSSIGMIT